MFAFEQVMHLNFEATMYTFKLATLGCLSSHFQDEIVACANYIDNLAVLDDFAYCYGLKCRRVDIS
jgi:hypothetical protein